MNKIKQKEAKIGPLKTSIIMNGYLQSRSLANLVKVSPIGTIVGWTLTRLTKLGLKIGKLLYRNDWKKTVPC